MKKEALSCCERNYIICVASEQVILNQLETQLEEGFKGIYTITSAESAEEALSLIEEIEKEGCSISLVLSDKALPEMPGERFLEQVSQKLPAVCKILLVDRAGLDSVKYAINHAGIDKYIEKPWDKETLLEIVRPFLLGQKAKHTLQEDISWVRETIQNVDIFRDLSSDGVDLIADRLHLLNFSKDTTLFMINDPGDCMYIIKSGEVKMIAGMPGSGEILAYLGRGSYFGEMSLLTGKPRESSIMTSMDSELLILTKNDFDYFLQKYPSMLIMLHSASVQRLRDFSIKNAEGQNSIICVLNSIQDEHKQTIAVDIARKLRKETNGKVVVIDLNLPQHQIASMERLPQEPVHLHWIIENFYHITEEKLSQILLEDEDGVQFFIPTSQEVLSLSSHLIQFLSVFKEFYHFVFVNFRIASDLERDIIKTTMEHANTIVYLLDQTEASAEKKFAFLQHIVQECAHLVKKFEFVATCSPSKQFVPEELESLIEQAQIHYLRLDDTSMDFLSGNEDTVGGNGLDRKISRVNHDVGRIARQLGKISFGLALGGGGARAYAHLGILKVLEEEGIPIDMIAGTDMGAFVGALYIMGKSVKEILEISHESWRKLISPVSWTFPRVALIKTKRIQRLVHDIFGDILIEDLPLPFFCVAGDLVSGQEVVIGRGKLYKAILATIAIPGFFEPVPLDNMSLIYGGVVNNVPGDVLKKKGIDLVLAVDVTPEHEVHLSPGMDRQGQSPDKQSIFQRIAYDVTHIKSRFGTMLLPRIIMRMIAIEGMQITRNKSRYFDILLKPNLENFDFFDFRRLPQIVESGEQAVRQELAKIQETRRCLHLRP